MTSRIVSLVLAVTLAVSACSTPARRQPFSQPPLRPPMPPGSVFDDFLGPAGSPPNNALWDYDIGPYQ
ncbi:MAG: hypothetical protein QOF66_776, partial [Mycobacterium sp.]|nr:hypothetical protein [Mycobacterium sp.]